MRMLERHVRTSRRATAAGSSSRSTACPAAPSHRDWFYYVNGIEASQGAATTAVHHGDRIWWDLHDWSATDCVPAVVGSFPEPFLHGIGGKRLPTTIECATDAGAACKRVSSELTALGVPVATQLIGTGSGTDSLGVVVGTWRDLRREIAGEPDRTRARGERRLRALLRRRRRARSSCSTRTGQVVRTLGAGAGLVAATAQGSAEPDVADHRHRRRRRDRRRRRADAGRAARPLRARRPGRAPPAGAARGDDVSYRRRASPLHAARAAAGVRYCLALALAALLLSAPVALGAVAARDRAAGVAAGVGREMRRAALFALPLGLLVMVINALVARDGLTVISRLGDLPVLGQTDITLEATVYGAILGLRAVALVLCGALYTVAVDPDEVLRLFRRVSFRSALTATLGDPDGPGPGPRLAPARRRAALPSRAPAVARRADARDDRRACSTARSTSPPRSRSAATARRAGRRGRAAP